MANDHKYGRRSKDCRFATIESETMADYVEDSDSDCEEEVVVQPQQFVQMPAPKDPCPLKSFCDYGLREPCAQAPYVDPFLPRRPITTWKINYLVSNNPTEAAHYDPELVHPRGIVIWNNQLWISNLMSDKITNYDLFGNQMLGPIQIRWNRGTSSFPTGLAVNCSSGFAIAGINAIGTNTATLMTATKTGDVVAYNPEVNARRGFVVINTKITREVSDFTGLAVVNDRVYLANFFQGAVDIFDGEYNRAGIQGRIFIDNNSSDPIPGSYGPFNVNYIAPYLYVTYAEREPGLFVHNNRGQGKGFISVFNLDGGFVRRFHSRGPLNAPWSVIPAPNECGYPPGAVLVSNIGDGKILIFDCNGNYLGPMIGQSGKPIVIQGIQGLCPYYTSFNEIFWTASGDIETRGLMGSLVKDQVIYV